MLAQAQRLGFPIMVKPANGGGGLGMFPVTDEAALLKTIEKPARSPHGVLVTGKSIWKNSSFTRDT